MPPTDRLDRAPLPDGFDDLRKQYRKRRELSSLRVTNAAVLDPAALATCGFSMTARFSCHVSLSPSANFLVETRAERRAEKRSPPEPVAWAVGVVHAAAGERAERGPPLPPPPLVSRRCWVWTAGLGPDPDRMPEEELLFLKDFMALWARISVQRRTMRETAHLVAGKSKLHPKTVSDDENMTIRENADGGRTIFYGGGRGFASCSLFSSRYVAYQLIESPCA